MPDNRPLPQFNFTGGIDQSMAPTKSSLDSPFLLTNFRQKPDERGKLQQTPWWRAGLTLTQGTYYNGSSLAEPTTSVVRGALPYNTDTIFVTDYCYTKWDGATQTAIRAYEMVGPSGFAVPPVVTDCLRIDLGTANITLGLSLDVEATSTSTFRWRINGGAYTTGISFSVTGTVIGGGVATVYSKVATGFSSQIWNLYRTDCTFDVQAGTVATRATRPIQYRVAGNNVFFLNNNYRLCTYNGSYIMTAAYFPVRGYHLDLFEGHVFLLDYQAGYYTDSTGSFTSLQNPNAYLIGNGDNTDIHDFLSTDVNEADTYSLPGGSYMLGCTVLNSRFFVMTAAGIYYTDYSGLPIPFNFRIFNPFTVFTLINSNADIWNFPNCATLAANYAYLMTDSGIWKFDGNSLEKFSKPIEKLFASSLITVNGYGFLNKVTYYSKILREFMFISDNFIYGFQEDFGTFYRRGCGTAASIFTFRQTSGSTVFELFSLGLPSRKIWREENLVGSTTPEKDDATLSAYVVPSIITQYYDGQADNVSEVEGTRLCLNLADLGINTTWYSTNANLVYQLYWYTDPAGEYTTPLTDAAAILNSIANPSGDYSYPRVSFYALALEIRLVGTATKPPYRATVSYLRPTLTLPAER